MTMRRILQCVLVVFVLSLAGCTRNEPEPPTTRTEKNTTVTTKPSTSTTTPLQSSSNVNVRNSNDTAKREAGRTSTEKSLPAGSEAENANKGAGKESDPPTGTTPISEHPDDQRQAEPSQITKGTEPTQKDSKETKGTFPSGVMDWVIVGLSIAGGLLVLVVIWMGVKHLRNQSRRHFETMVGKAAAAQASVTREAQKELLEKISSLSSAQSDTNGRLHDVHTEVRSLARLMRESSPARSDGRSYASIATSYVPSEPLPLKEEPEFPVSANDYLDKMTRYSNVVKPDFQNGILINDRDGKGELMLIKDSRLPDETQPLFVVPRHAQFQTKQDYYTYYEKYYDCSRPSAGDVWIIEPAVVEKVSGGWLLREKGVLEIR